MFVKCIPLYTSPTFFISNINCGYTVHVLTEAILTCTHDLNFEQKNKENVIHLQMKFLSFCSCKISVIFMGMFSLWFDRLPFT